MTVHALICSCQGRLNKVNKVEQIFKKLGFAWLDKHCIISVNCLLILKHTLRVF